MVKNSRLIFSFLICGIFLINSSNGLAQSPEERFRDLFVTAGYATAFGAALGAATLSFKSRPENHLRFIAVGASLGFIGGSFLGSYVVFSPIFSLNQPNHKPLDTNWAFSQAPVSLSPTFDIQNRGRVRMTGVNGQWTLARF